MKLFPLLLLLGVGSRAFAQNEGVSTEAFLSVQSDALDQFHRPSLRPRVFALDGTAAPAKSVFITPTYSDLNSQLPGGLDLGVFKMDFGHSWRGENYVWKLALNDTLTRGGNTSGIRLNGNSVGLFGLIDRKLETRPAGELHATFGLTGAVGYTTTRLPAGSIRTETETVNPLPALVWRSQLVSPRVLSLLSAAYNYTHTNYEVAGKLTEHSSSGIFSVTDRASYSITETFSAGLLIGYNETLLDKPRPGKPTSDHFTISWGPIVHWTVAPFVFDFEATYRAKDTDQHVIRALATLNYSY